MKGRSTRAVIDDASALRSCATTHDDAWRTADQLPEISVRRAAPVSDRDFAPRTGPVVQVGQESTVVHAGGNIGGAPVRAFAGPQILS